MLVIHTNFPITTLVYEFSIYMYVNNIRKGTSYWSNLMHFDLMIFFWGLWPNPMTQLNLWTRWWLRSTINTHTSMKRRHFKSHNPLFLTSLKVHTFSKALKSSLSLSLPLPASLSQRAQQMYPYNLQLMET